MPSSNLLGIIGSISIGTSDFLVKINSSKNKVLFIIFWTQLIGALLLIPLMSLSVKHSVGIHDILPAILLGTLDFATTFLIYRAFSKGKASIISPILSAFIAVSVIFTFIVFKETLPLNKFVSAILAFLGIILISIEFNYKRKFSTKILAGIPEAILATFLLGIYFPVWGKLVQNQDWLLTIIVVRTTIAIFSYIFILVSKQSKQLISQREHFPSLFLIGAINVFSQVSSSLAFKLTSKISVTSIIISTSPMITIYLAHLFLKERFQGLQKVGALLTICSTIYLSSL